MSPSPSPIRRPSSSRVLRGRMTRSSSASPFFRLALLARHRNQGQPVAIGRDEGHRVRLQDEERAIQKIAGVFAGDGELRLRHHLLDDIPRQLGAERATRLRQRRKVLARQRLHPRVETIGSDLDAVLVFLDSNVGVWQRLHDLVELLCRQRQSTALRDRRGTPTAQSNLEVGGEELHLVAVRLEQHIREDRNRVLAFDDALEQLQFAQQIGLTDDQFHVVMTSRESAGPARRSLY